MNIKVAITNYLQQQFNDIYQEVYGVNAERPFVFNCDFVRDDGNFRLYDSNGNLVLDQYHNEVKYIPCSVYSIIADRVEIPNIQILDATIPIEIFASEDRLEEVLLVLSLFQDRINGVPFTISADYQGSTETYNILMTFNLPDDDDFLIFNGINGKLINFQISANISVDIIYGNAIQYSLSIDGGNTFTDIVKIKPTSLLAIDTYSDQQINGERVKSTPKTATWSLTTQAIVKKNSDLRKLIYYIDIPYGDMQDIYYTLENAYLKTTYDFTNLPIIKPNSEQYYIENSTLDISKGFRVKIQDLITFVETFAIDDSYSLKLTNSNNNYIELTLTKNSTKSQIQLATKIGNTTEYKTLYENRGGGIINYYTQSISNDLLTFVYDTTTRGILTITQDTYTIDSDVSGTLSVNYFYLYPYYNYYIKPVTFASLSYDAENADIIILTMELRDRLE